MRLLISLVAMLLLAILVCVEVFLSPTTAERQLLYTTFGASAVLTTLAGWLMIRHGRQATTIRTSVLLPPVASVAVAGAVVAGAAVTMFLSPHDLRLVSVALVLGMGLGWLLAGSLVRPLADDLHRLAEVAREVAGGNLAGRTGVVRHDEIGEVATAIDSLVGHLARAEQERERDERARRAFLAAIGHDLRTPLSSLQATLEALQDGLADDPDRYLGSMSADLAFLRGMVDDLFMMARIESGDLDLNPVPVALDELCDEVLEAMRPLADRRGLTLTLDSPARVEVAADPRAVARVIRNLVDNAIRHAPVDSEVTVSLSRLDGFAEVAVTDQGPGFSSIASPGSSLDGSWVEASRPRQGARSGLGLTIAGGLVAAHGGEVRVEQSPGGRVVFTLNAEGPF